MRTNIKIILVILLMGVSYAFAGTRWEVTIINYLNQEFQISISSSKCWNNDEFASGRNFVAAANDQWVDYTNYNVLDKVSREDSSSWPSCSGSRDRTLIFTIQPTGNTNQGKRVMLQSSYFSDLGRSYSRYIYIADLNEDISISKQAAKMSDSNFSTGNGDVVKMVLQITDAQPNGFQVTLRNNTVDRWK